MLKTNGLDTNGFSTNADYRTQIYSLLDYNGNPLFPDTYYKSNECWTNAYILNFYLDDDSNECKVIIFHLNTTLDTGNKLHIY